MNFSDANTGLWNVMVQFGYIAGIILLANIMRRKIPLIQKTLMPTAVLGGFLLLILRISNLVRIDLSMLEMITYHGIALGFIAMSLRVPNASEDVEKDTNMTAAKSGAVIVGSYLIQGVLGLLIALLLIKTMMPDLFPASGILLPMGYGQGPGQANNVGTTYENLGFVGGRSFGLSIAAAGYLSACVVGVFYLNVMHRKGKLKVQKYTEVSGSVTVDTFQDENEIPISESVDKLSVQIAMVLLGYFLTYFTCLGLSRLMDMIGEGAANTVNPLLWGFNFIIGSVIAMVMRLVLKRLHKARVMTRQYQNNYLLSRISGLAFDLMIIAGIASIEIKDLQGLWLPFLIMSITGAYVTLVYLQVVCKWAYPGYFYEGLLSMYGMMTGTVSSGVLLLREIDPEFETPAANNLITGSSMAIVFGAPMLLLISIAPYQPVLTMVIMTVYFVGLMFFIAKAKVRKKGK